MPDDGQNGETETTETETSGGTTDAGDSTETGSAGTDNGGRTDAGGSGESGSNAGDKGGEGDDLSTVKKHMRTWQERAGENKGRAEKAEKERDEHAQTLAAVRKAFGLDQDEDDPKKVAEQAQNTAAEKDLELRAMRLDRAAEKAGRKAGADVDRLTDSKAFNTASAKLDPESDSFADDMAALVEKFLDDHPHLKAKTETPPPSSQDMTDGGEGGGSGGGSTDDDDLDAISAKYAERHGR